MNDKWAEYKKQFCGCKDGSRLNSCKGLPNCGLRDGDPERKTPANEATAITLIISRELAERLTNKYRCTVSQLEIHKRDIEELSALLAAPVVERQEPVAYEYYSRPLHCWRPLETEADKSRAESMGCAVRVAEKPVTVAVVLPERMTREQALELTDYPPESAMYWYNKALDDVRACLDKVKEMNQ